ncbi:DUF3800 domain-containing protein [bacterium]|nr:DUF3800 domain-containing protein [bacterium]RQV92060.1 MAG: DUF3800 domain-containing protein [bacterium]
MHMMFVDESGDPGYPKDKKWIDWGGSKLYIRVGVIIHGWKWKTWNERLIRFKKQNGLSWNAEVKASHIRKGKKEFSGWDKPRRVLFFDDLLSLIGGNIDITILSVSINKALVDTSKIDRFVKPEIRSFELLLERYNSFLDIQSDKSGIVVLDPVCAGSDDNIRYFQSYLQAYSTHLKPLRIVEGTFFAKSHTSNMVQIADICSNVFYRKEINTKKSNDEFKTIYPRFWRRNNRVSGYGIKRWPVKKAPRKF